MFMLCIFIRQVAELTFRGLVTGKAEGTVCSLGVCAAELVAVPAVPCPAWRCYREV